MSLEIFKTNPLTRSKFVEYINCPEIFEAKYIKNNYKENENNENYIFGSLYHCLILEPDKFKDRYIVSDLTLEGLMGDFINRLASNEYSEEYALECYQKSGFQWKFETVIEKFKKEPKNVQYYYLLVESKLNNKKIISEEMYKTAREMKEAFITNGGYDLIPLVGNILIEQVLNYQISNKDKTVFIDIESVLDHIEFDDYNRLVLINDLKSTTCKSKDEFEGSIKKYRYDIQDWFYLYAIEILYTNNPNSKYYGYDVRMQFIAQYKRYPYHILGRFSISEKQQYKTHGFVSKKFKEFVDYYQNYSENSTKPKVYNLIEVDFNE